MQEFDGIDEHDVADEYESVKSNLNAKRKRKKSNLPWKYVCSCKPGISYEKYFSVYMHRDSCIKIGNDIKIRTRKILQRRQFIVLKDEFVYDRI